MRIKRVNESIFSNLYNNTDKESKYYKYLGERNSNNWRNSLENILIFKQRVEMNENMIKKISYLLKDICNLESNPVQYPTLKNAVNSRFEYCWFLNSTYPVNRIRHSWDICIQMFSDEWFLVDIGSGEASYDYWYICDQFDGLENLVKDTLI